MPADLEAGQAGILDTNILIHWERLPARLLPERRLDEAPVAQDHELRRHRVLLLQQVAVIAALLIVGCVLGLVLGIRPPAT